MLVPEKQSSVDIGVHVEEWALTKSQSQQPFYAMCKRLIYSINTNPQASTILMANVDFIVNHRLEIDQATTTAAKGAFLLLAERGTCFNWIHNTVFLELDPSHQDLLFHEISMEDLDLESIMGYEVSLELQTMILTAVKQSQANNQQMVQLWDSKARSLYSAAAGLVNDGVETLRGLGKVQRALDICQPSIMRKSGPFVKPSYSLAGVKL